MSVIKITQAVKFSKGDVRSVRFIQGVRGYRVRCKGFPNLTICGYESAHTKDTFQAFITEGGRELFVTARTPEQAYKCAMRQLWV